MFLSLRTVTTGKSSTLRNEIKRAKPEPMHNHSFRRLIIALALVLILTVLSPAIRADEALTERNKKVVRDFYTTVLIGRDVEEQILVDSLARLSAIARAPIPKFAIYCSDL